MALNCLPELVPVFKFKISGSGPSGFYLNKKIFFPISVMENM